MNDSVSLFKIGYLEKSRYIENVHKLNNELRIRDILFFLSPVIITCIPVIAYVLSR
jgi:hypothetical protein